MMKITVAALVALWAAVTLTGCGGGGGAAAGPVTTGVTKVQLFGNMSTNCTVGSVQTTMQVPSGVLVNYSSPAPSNYPAHTFPLKSGAVVPSGPVRFQQSDISGTYNTQTMQLTVSMVNSAGSNITSSTTGSGQEIATIMFKLATPGVLPTLPTPWQDPQVVVWQRFPTTPYPTIVSRPGYTLNFATTYQ
ncbi:hypothetical protein L4X63_23335 [Geomonas sp. Red32]|uniref:hypothetical protein n=1 Tax=Geomonas sp. Red32 TaxID=2912856 RepID=UPI00202CB207|nr:hypothetical protein [Geomonas sp. Red32]MCM0084514.1 hypothetical protein [Geomonas sp. Red32]